MLAAGIVVVVAVTQGFTVPAQLSDRLAEAGDKVEETVGEITDATAEAVDEATDPTEAATPSATGSPEADPTQEQAVEQSPCSVSTPLVDPDATPAATCLAATLDGWIADGRYGLGQQLNVSSGDYLEPVTALAPARPAIVGFDLAELAEGVTFSFETSPVEGLLRLSDEGVLLTASWHTDNPGTGWDAGDRDWQDLGELLDPGTAAYTAFWDDFDAKMALVLRLQTGDDGRHRPAAVLFRPFHEANGDWFWWAQGADDDAYKQVYAAMQERAASLGVHNIVWGWSANAVTHDGIADPLAKLPDAVDVVGIDSYESMADVEEQAESLDLTGLAEVAGRGPRASVAEAGPHGSTDGAWDPAVVARSAVAVGVRPSYVMFWFDDGDGDDGYSGKKELASLRNGRALAESCPDGVCALPG
ncbi:MAG: hypothetical protein CMH83_23695 [Nocardioides sp.]|nr:hypothetical protein [Nocardioides sp.]